MGYRRVASVRTVPPVLTVTLLTTGTVTRTCRCVKERTYMSDSTSLKSLNVLTTEGVAEAAGLSVGSVRVMVIRARKRAEAGRSLPTDLPTPDLSVFRSPLWKKSTITAWMKRREKAGLGASSTSPAKKAEPKKAAKPAAKKASPKVAKKAVKKATKTAK